MAQIIAKVLDAILVNIKLTVSQMNDIQMWNFH